MDIPGTDLTARVAHLHENVQMELIQSASKLLTSLALLSKKFASVKTQQT